MEEHLPSAIARIGLLVLLVTLVIRWVAGDPATWRRRPERAHRLQRVGDALGLLLTLAIAGFAVVAAVLYPAPFGTGLTIIAIMAVWAALLLAVVMGIELAVQKMRPDPVAKRRTRPRTGADRARRNAGGHVAPGARPA